MLRPIQRIYPLEIRSNENLQRGLEESIPTVSETLSPDEDSGLGGKEGARISRDLRHIRIKLDDCSPPTGRLAHLPIGGPFPPDLGTSINGCMRRSDIMV
ncbi:hypothetical protein TNCV_1313351 [Trichonephila clavipes]|nr:hypothetical protein TNCV_1313351 [Trichonephila clavipes]